MKVKLEDVCEKDSSNLKLSELMEWMEIILFMEQQDT